jgi:peptidoglycan biosynthesis protein MviN/MurJ (putative lipid II flippase)
VSVVLDLLLIQPFGASGAAAAASAAFLAGGAVSAVAYRREMGYRWSELVPGVADVAFLRVVAERALRRDRSGS